MNITQPGLGGVYQGSSSIRKNRDLGGHGSVRAGRRRAELRGGRTWEGMAWGGTLEGRACGGGTWKSRIPWGQDLVKGALWGGIMMIFVSMIKYTISFIFHSYNGIQI